jgi:4-hydroxybenzoate polyprenyltransferase
LKLSERIHAWLQLVRAPNLLTVPGDPLAGFLLSGGGGVLGIFQVLPIVLSSLCFYCFGLIMNDLADVKIDKEERPNRPIPSGRVSLPSARIASVFFMVWGLSMAWLTSVDAGIVGSALAAAVISYNVLLKDRPIAGPVSMGACRGLSMMMGAAVGGGVDYRVAVAIAGLTVYIAAVTSIARLEMKNVVVGAKRWFPSIVLLGTFCSLFWLSRETFSDLSLVLKPALPALLSVGLAVMCGRRLRRTKDVPGVIGGLIANVMLVQASVCALSGTTGQMVGALVACMVPLFVISALKFYSS